MNMTALLLLLLLTLQGTTDAASVTLTESGDSADYPWPASGTIRISLKHYIAVALYHVFICTSSGEEVPVDSSPGTLTRAI